MGPNYGIFEEQWTVETRKETLIIVSLVAFAQHVLRKTDHKNMNNHFDYFWELNPSQE